MTRAIVTEAPPGATLHLGGDAFAHPSLESRLVPIESITPYPDNPRRGEQEAITASIRDLGLYAGVVVQRSTGRIVVGNHRRHGLVDLGAQLIPVDFLDVDDTRAAAIVARDNRTSDMGGYDDADLLALLSSEPEVLALSGYGDDDLAALVERILDSPGADVPFDPNDPLYTRKMDPIQYHPTMDRPPSPADMVNRSKAEELVAQITATEGLPPEVSDFLIAGAQRHLVFNYANVAEFYAHADPEVQALMEASALVIVDYEDAILHGYVRITSRLRELREEDLAHRATLDGKTPDDA